MDFNEERRNTAYVRKSIQIDRKSMLANPRKSIAMAKKASMYQMPDMPKSKSCAANVNAMADDEDPRRLSQIGKIRTVKSVQILDDVQVKRITQAAKKEAPGFLISMRFFLALLAFLAYTVQYTQKTDISVAIVCMLNNTALSAAKAAAAAASNTSITTSSSDSAGCLFNTSHTSTDGPFTWDSSTQGLLLCAYFIGYMISEVPGGILSLRFGSKIVIDVAILVGSIFTLLIPALTRLHWGGLFACRLIVGFAHGTLWPAFSGFWASWAPPAERSRLIGIANAGSQIGNVIAFPLGSFLCDNGFDGGWGSIFYVFGAFGIVWFILWTIFSSDSPGENRFIRPRERDYILEETKEIVEAHHKGHNEAPWRFIFTSKACWAIFIGHTCSNWGTYLFLTNLPTYMKTVLKFDIHSNGLFSALPYIVFWFSIIASGILSDLLMVTCGLKKTLVRKIFNAFGFAVPLGAVIGLIFVDCSNPYIGVVMLCLAMAFTGCCYGAGFLVNYNDIAGPYSGIVFGIGNTFATIPGIVAPYLVGVLTPHQLQSEWRIVFIITAIIYGIGGIISLIFTHTGVQPWAVLHDIEIVDEIEVIDDSETVSSVSDHIVSAKI